MVFCLSTGTNWCWYCKKHDWCSGNMYIFLYCTSFSRKCYSSSKSHWPFFAKLEKTSKDTGTTIVRVGETMPLDNLAPRIISGYKWWLLFWMTSSRGHLSFKKPLLQRATTLWETNIGPENSRAGLSVSGRGTHHHMGSTSWDQRSLVPMAQLWSLTKYMDLGKIHHMKMQLVLKRTIFYFLCDVSSPKRRSALGILSRKLGLRFFPKVLTLQGLVALFFLHVSHMGTGSWVVSSDPFPLNIAPYSIYINIYIYLMYKVKCVYSISYHMSSLHQIILSKNPTSTTYSFLLVWWGLLAPPHADAKTELNEVVKVGDEEKQMT